MTPESPQIRAAEQRYPDLFAFLDSAIEMFCETIEVKGLPAPSTPLALVRVAAIIRTFNLLKSIRQLLATDHWENAAILMRSLFELLLNIEEIGREPEQAEAKAKRFVMFETLQKFRRTKAISQYELNTGRKSEHDAGLITIEQALPTIFPEWASGRRKDGTIRWGTSWCGRTVRQLCEAGGSSVRMGQYEIVYAYGSDLAHSSPLGVLSTFQWTHAEDWTRVLEQCEESERQQTLMVLSLSVTFAFEVVGHSEFLDGAFDALRILEISRTLYRLYDVEPPPFPPAIDAEIRRRAKES